MTTFEPIRLLEVELSSPLPSIGPVDERTGQVYGRALCLVRIHREPIGLVPLTLQSGGLTSSDVREAVWGLLAPRIERHLEDDGLGPDEEQIDLAAGPVSAFAPCLLARDRLHADGPSVTVIVPTRDRPEQLAACLTGLVALEYPSFEIVVIDNSRSSSAAREIVRDVRDRFPRIRYEREERPGPSWARNRGLAVADAPLVAFIDDDVLVDSSWLSALVGAFDRVRNVGCVTGMILAGEAETKAQLLLEEYGGFSKGFERLVFGLDGADRPSDPLFPYTAGTFGSGASMAFRTSVLRQLGGFNLALGSGDPACGGEELDIFLRVLTSGYRLVYEPSAIVRHFHPRDYGQLRQQVRRYGVGLGAYLTACVAQNPKVLCTFAGKAPQARRYFFSGRSPKNQRRGRSYPRDLVLAEVLGLLSGPPAYVRGRRSVRVLRKVGAGVWPNELRPTHASLGSRR